MLKLVFLLTWLVWAQQSEASDIDQILSLPEDKIDVGIAALTFAKEIYPDLDIQAYSRKIDYLADETRQLAGGTTDPERRIRVLNTVIYRIEGFHYDRDPFSRSKQEYYFLNGILDTKQGICYSMPLLYIAVAQRLGWPIYPVIIPDHVFARYVDPTFDRQNIETTSGGKYSPDESYVADFFISAKGIKNGNYLKTLSYREFLSEMLVANAMVFGERGEGNRGIAYLEKALELNPRLPDLQQSLGEAYTAKSEIYKGTEAVRFREIAKRHLEKAKALGFVGMETIETNREMKTRGN